MNPILNPIHIDPLQVAVIVSILKRDYATAVTHRLTALRDCDVPKHEFHNGESMTIAGVLGMLGQTLPEVPTYSEFIASNPCL